MLNPMLLHEVMHLLRNKLRAIIRYDLLWKTICREKMTEHFDRRKGYVYTNVGRVALIF